jgi:inner membrane protein involved in colicin E2 resistance
MERPSFNGSILPQATELKDTGLLATWKSKAHTRSLPPAMDDDAFKKLIRMYLFFFILNEMISAEMRYGN